MTNSSSVPSPAGGIRSFFVSLQPFLNRTGTFFVDPVEHSIARLIGMTEARKQLLLPFQRAAGKLFVAAVDPAVAVNSRWFKELQEHGTDTIVLCRVLQEDLDLAILRVYGQFGREEATANDKRLGGILLQRGKLSGSQLIGALDLQQATGIRLGAILSSTNSVTSWDVAEALALQKSLPAIELMDFAGLSSLMHDPSLGEIWKSIPDSFWHRHLTVPVAKDGRTLMVAMVDPDDTEALVKLAAASHCSIRVMVTGYRDIVAALAIRFSKQYEADSRMALAERQPEESAHQRMSKGQLGSLVGLALIILVGAFMQPILTFTVVAALVQLIYGANSLFRLWLMQRSAQLEPDFMVNNVDLTEMRPVSLPPYTILVPLYKESAVLPTLTAAIRNLQYPKDRLDVKLLLEEDDEETIRVALDAKLPSYFELVIVPASEPRTKPKACNYGLMRARGEFVVIFDAEDIPDSDQLLKAIAVFRQNEDRKLACVQAKLSYYNADQNILTRWFTAEYANWFELSLPSLFAYDLPVPLGGTSNHFRTDVLREMGAWDPFNVTEDADLGIRLHKRGYRTAIVNSTTLEEANADFVNWMRQRSRWVKGYMQTWLVHMRRPIKLHRALGLKGSLAFHMIIGATPLTFLLNPVLWGLTIGWFLFQPSVYQQVFQGWVYYLAELNFFFGNFAFTYVNIVGVMRRNNWPLVKYALLSPIYWTFMSISAWKGLYQLMVRPSYWEKTTHGLAKFVPPALSSDDAADV